MTVQKTQTSITHLPENIPELKSIFNVTGLSFILLLKSYLSILTFRIPRHQIVEQIVVIGFNTLFMVILISVFSGMVMSLEIANWLEDYGARETVGGLLCATSIIEIAPVFVSFAIGAQAGTAITAELAHMQITEQISAMRLFKISPVNYLIAPRLCAMLYSLPFAIIIGAFFSILGGGIVAHYMAKIEISLLLDSVWQALKLKDVWYSIIKGFVIGNYLIAIHTAFGLGTRGGAKEVGTMTSISTIWTAVGIICIDAVLDYILYLE